MKESNFWIHEFSFLKSMKISHSTYFLFKINQLANHDFFFRIFILLKSETKNRIQCRRIMKPIIRKYFISKSLIFILFSVFAIVSCQQKVKKTVPDSSVIPEWFSDTTKVDVIELGEIYSMADYGAVGDDSTLKLNDDAIAWKGGKSPWADEDPNNGPNTMEDIEGSGVNCIYIRPWTQFFDLKGRETPPVLISENITLRNIKMNVRTFTNIGITEHDRLKDFTFEKNGNWYHRFWWACSKKSSCKREAVIKLILTKSYLFFL